MGSSTENEMRVKGSILALCCTKFLCSPSYWQHSTSLRNRSMAASSLDKDLKTDMHHGWTRLRLAMQRMTSCFCVCYLCVWLCLPLSPSTSTSLYLFLSWWAGRRFSLNLLERVQHIENPFSVAVTAILFHWIKWGQSNKSEDYTEGERVG